MFISFSSAGTHEIRAEPDLHDIYVNNIATSLHQNEMTIPRKVNFLAIAGINLKVSGLMQCEMKCFS